MNSGFIIPDTNVFLRYFLKDIVVQSDQAKLLLNQAKLGKVQLIIPQIVIFEIVFALSKLYGFSKEEVIEKVDVLLASDYLKIQDKESFQKAADIFQTNNISFPDSFLIAKAQEAEADLFTFDRDLNRINSGIAGNL